MLDEGGAPWSDYAVRFGEPDEGGVVRFLCEERAFGRKRVRAALERLRPRRS